MRYITILILLFLLLFGCSGYSFDKKVNQTSEVNKTTENNNSSFKNEEYNFTSPFAYVEYKNDTEIDEIYYYFEKNGFSGCKVKLNLDKTGKLRTLQFVDMLEPGKNNENIFVKTSNCTGHDIILNEDKAKIAKWLANVLSENSDVTGLYDKNTKMTITEINDSGRIMDIRVDSPKQSISGYPVKSIYGDINGVGNIISTRIALSEYNGTRYYWITIRGSYYPEPKVKIKPKLNLEEAKEKLIEQYNKKMDDCKKTDHQISETVAPRYGCDSINRTMFLTEDEEKDIDTLWKSSLVVINSENNTLQRLEYRLVWSIVMKRNCNNDAYVDAITGEMISVTDHCEY